MHRGKWCIKAAVWAALFFFLAAAGCTSTNDEEASEKPPLPAEIQREGEAEPVLLVYMAEEDTVEELPFEEYIMGVVAAEMDPRWPLNALAAQAIIARTFTLQKIAEDGGVPERGAHASTDIEEFQAYSAARINDQVRKAVNNTRGKVIIFENEFIRAWFHAFAGPRTAFADEGLDFEEGNPPYIQSVTSPAGDVIPPEEREWLASFTDEEIRRAVQAATGKDPGPVTGLEIAEKGPSGRVTVFRVNDVEISAPALRINLGSTEMRSAYLESLEIRENAVMMSGTGYGHGVGMCQWGARAMAEEGASPEEIINYFYNNVEIMNLWD